MINFKKTTIKRKAKRRKNWIEKVLVYPYPVRIKEQDYYLVNYIKAKQITGSAVLSDGTENSADVHKAHEKLHLFYSLTEKIKTEGQMRAGVNIDFFRKPLNLIDEKPQPSLQKGYDSIKTVLNMQLKYKKTYDDFQYTLQYLEDNKQPITSTELDNAIETAAMLDVLQYEIVNTLAKDTPILREWIEEMKKAGLWDRLTKAQQVFYLQLLKNEELMKEESSKMPVVKHESFEKMIKFNKDRLKSFKRQEQQQEVKDLRQP
ncbi:hypothetical protein [Alkalicoccus halolimnae]|uniref:Uncharacterized protein n=1 Tax=Alkalicoccus halolimnae TaxID=1667239 RepID=A0A5C7FHW5_9BACI|nr:hypothetical protein [Alkalicoccus halolimnae]TXF85066.1 hypothetical protein FTX54_09585 [Alkalicoccus halolimnae]